jgi:tetratricopeptide (TPR) repeat protein
MGQVLIFGSDSAEREGLAVALEFAGNRCFAANSLAEAVELLKREPCDIALVNPPLGGCTWEQLAGAFKSASPNTTAILLTEDADTDTASSTTADELITLSHSPVGNLSPQFSEVGRSEVLLILLPEEEPLSRWSGLPETPGMLNKLAVLYHFQEKYGAAERLYKQALKISERKFGPQHHSVATILNNLARLYHDQKRLTDAGNLYKRSLAIVKKAFGDHHVKVARRLRNIAELERTQAKAQASKLAAGKVRPGKASASQAVSAGNRTRPRR